MSGAERERREKYRQQRKKWLLIQGIAIAFVAIVMIVTFFAYRNVSKTVYITYQETSSVDYRVKLKPNEFYEEEWLEKDQAYVASLVDDVSAEFKYELDMDVENADYEYSYTIEAVLEIVDDKSDKPFYTRVGDDPNGEYKPLKKVENVKQNSNNKLIIKETVLVDYAWYNDFAKKFVDINGLSAVTSSLTVRMSVSVVGSCEQFQEDSQNHYVVSLHMPLTEKAITIQMKSSIPTGESKVMACESGCNVTAFKTVFIVGGALELVLIVGLLCSMFFTRNDDINYSIRVQKLLSSYGSYIQKIKNGFDTNGYQLLAVDTFNEMLAIRDTIQSPILMSENRDKTRSLFLIPTNTKILYTYELKVENYDELYADEQGLDGAAILKDEMASAEVAKQEPQKPAEPVAQSVEQPEPAATAEAETEVVSAPETEPATEPEAEIEQAEVAFGDRFGSSLDYSFEAKLALSDENVRKYYKDVTDYALSYGVKLVRSRKRERIYMGRTVFAALIFRGRKLSIALAMNPAEVHAKYHAKDISAVKKFEKTPMLMHITSGRKVKYAINLLEELFSQAGLKNKNLPINSKLVKQRSKKYLFEKGLIRVRERKS